MTAALLDQLATARFDALLDGAAAGAPLLLRTRRADTLPRLLDRARTGPLMLDVAEVGAAGAPVDALRRAAATLGVGADDLADLLTAPGLRHALLVAEVGGDASGWSTVAGAWASLRRRAAPRGPALILITQPVRPPAGCTFFDDGALFGPIESALLARSLRPEGGLLAQTADAAAIEVARGDGMLLGAMMRLSDVERLDPSDWLARQPPRTSPAPLLWRNEEAPCPCWLVRHDAAALRRRVWRGHLTVLLPWLEETRSRFLTRYVERLPAGQIDRASGETVDPADYEWGHIVAAMRKLPAAPATAADTMRRVRNALAHGDPAAPDDCRRLDAEAQRLLAWR